MVLRRMSQSTRSMCGIQATGCLGPSWLPLPWSVGGDRPRQWNPWSSTGVPLLRCLSCLARYCGNTCQLLCSWGTLNAS
eukprot:32965-Karenia_brevis.AAC.1